VGSMLHRSGRQSARVDTLNIGRPSGQRVVLEGPASKSEKAKSGVSYVQGKI
jgi:hypothetical protein